MSNVIDLFTRQQIERVATKEESQEIFKPKRIRKARVKPLYDGIETSIPWYPRLGLFKSSAGKCTFNPETEQAYSYRWWRFVDRINGVLVFNKYRYSNMTSQHQAKVKRTMQQLGYDFGTSHWAYDFHGYSAKILFIEAPLGLQADLSHVVEHYQSKIAKLQAEIDKPRSLERKNLERKDLQDQYRDVIRDVKALIKKQKRKQA